MFTYLQIMTAKENPRTRNMDVSYPANLIGAFTWDAEAKANMMAYDKQTIKRLYNDVQRGNNPL
jgi:hypothetical protein